MELLRQAVKDFWDCTELIKATKKGEEDTTITYIFLENGKICENSINKCIERATVDITVRTLTKTHSEGTGVLKKLAEDIAKEGLCEYIIDWFEQKYSDYNDYNTWHKKACAKALPVINKYYKNKDGSDVCYGKAQKVVNMTMKSIYCLVCNDDTAFNEYGHLFDECHIPLDSYTMKWHHKYYKTDTKWSNLDETEYYEISANIARIFADGTVTEFYKKYTPLQAEFFIWEEEQMRALVGELEKGLARFEKNAKLMELLEINTDVIKRYIK